MRSMRVLLGLIVGVCLLAPSGSATAQQPSSDLAITKSGPGTAVAGTNIAYTLTATNSGPDVAASVVLSDALPAGVTFVSLTQTTGPAATLTTPPVGGTGTVTATWATLASGATATFTLIVNVNAVFLGTVANTAALTSATPDPDLTDNSATQNTTVSGEADLAVTKSGPANSAPGSNVSYTLSATNAGPSDAVGATLSDTLPAGVTFVSFAQTSGPAATLTTPPVGGGGTVTAAWVTLAAGATATFTLVVNVGAGFSGDLLNTATIASTTPDPDPTDNSSTASLAVTTTTTSTTTTSTTTTSTTTTIAPTTTSSTTAPTTTAGPTTTATTSTTPTTTIAPTTTVTGVIPATGGDSRGIAIAAIALVTAGVVVIAMARRRAHPDTAS